MKNREKNYLYEAISRLLLVAFVAFAVGLVAGVGIALRFERAYGIELCMDSNTLGPCLPQ